MSRYTPKDIAFISDCKSVASRILTAWADDVRCFYDGDPSYCVKKDYVLKASHCFGSAYCNWSHKKKELFDALRAVGAVNIIGKVDFNRVDIAFDIKKSRLKDDGLITKKS